MPGESLTCVWEAAYIHSPESKDTVMATELLKKVTAMFAKLSCVNYSSSKFDSIFKEKFTAFKDYKEYVNHHLREVGVPFTVLQNAIERECWEMCKSKYISKADLDDAQDVLKLWQIFNRLALECVFPPVLCKEESVWLIEHVGGALGKSSKFQDQKIGEKGSTFEFLIELLNEQFFRETPKADIKRCINTLHCWLVREIMKSGWIYKRTKKQSNWTAWAKRWCVLTPGRLTYYENEKGFVKATSSTKKGEVYFTALSRIESLPPYRGMVHKLKGRFRVSNEPYIQIELCTDDDVERRAWLSSIEEIVNAARLGTTPVQQLLQERYQAVKNLLEYRHSGICSAEVKENKEKVSNTENRLREFERRATLVLKRSDNASPNAESVLAPVMESAVAKDTTELLRSSPEEESNVPKLSLPPLDDSGEAMDNNMLAYTEDKMKGVFMKIDTDGNGFIGKDEFKAFIKQMGLSLGEKEFNLVYKDIDKDSSGHISFAEFSDYFTKVLLNSNEQAADSTELGLRSAFLAADRDGTGTLNFKEFAEYLWERKRSVRVSKLIKTFNTMDHRNEGEVSFQQFKDALSRHSSCKKDIPLEDPSKGMAISNLERKLKSVYDGTDSEELALYIRKRWDGFASFRRYGQSGQLVMKGGHGMVKDVVPGEYSLIDLACFSDLPALEPKHTTVKGVKWQSGAVAGKSGKLIFPPDFDGKVTTDIATNETLRYYDCSFADSNQVKISLLYRHGIQDFTYENQYLADYVSKKNGGSGLEKHEFSHLDCPLGKESGTFLLAKFVSEDEIHITGFKIPVRHTLYIPGGVIHSNDYLAGTWRTMLSDEAEIDHVHIVKPKPQHDNGFQHFLFQFQ